MSLKTTSIGALARALAAVGVIGGSLVPAVAAAQTQSPAQQADALAAAILQAVQTTIQTSPAGKMQTNVEAAVATVLDGADPQIAAIAVQRAYAMVIASKPYLQQTAAVEQAIRAAFLAEQKIVQAALDNGTGAIGAGPGGGGIAGPNGAANGGGNGGGGSHRPS
jgi:hypothetical protein